MVFQRPLIEKVSGGACSQKPPAQPPPPPRKKIRPPSTLQLFFPACVHLQNLTLRPYKRNLPLHRGWPLHAWRFNCSCILANCEFLPWKFCTFNKGKLTVTKLKLLLAPFFKDTTINSSRLHLLQYERVIQLANFI